MNKKIDIIIPAYNAQDTIDNLLASILCQTIVNQCRITIVNDCDGIGYEDSVNYYGKKMDIQELTLFENGGPGVARQFGLTNTVLPFVVFADADDLFSSPFSLEVLLTEIERYPKTGVVIAEHQLEVRDSDEVVSFHLYKKNYVWVFGKIYRRSVLDKYDIVFPPFRANEDVGFNQSLRLMTCLNDEEKPVFIEKTVYYWLANPKSITRSDNLFVYGENIVSYVHNMGYAVGFAAGLKNRHMVNKLAIGTLASAYVFLEQSKNKTRQFEQDILDACTKFYYEHYQVLEMVFPSSFVNDIVIETIATWKDTFTSYLPEQTYQQFLQQVRSNV